MPADRARIKKSPAKAGMRLSGGVGRLSGGTAYGSLPRAMAGTMAGFFREAARETMK